MNNSNKRGNKSGSRPKERLESQERASVLAFHKAEAAKGLDSLLVNQDIAADIEATRTAILNEETLAPVVQLRSDHSALSEQASNAARPGSDYATAA